MPRKPRPPRPVLQYPPIREALRIIPPPQREAMHQAEYDELDESEGAKRGKAAISDEDFDTFIGRAIDEGVQYDLEQMQPDRILAWEYYRGVMRDKPPSEGGSKVVSYDVRDTVLDALPSLLRVFFSGDNVVEFAPSRPQDQDNAELATAYVSKIVRDKLGVVGAHAAFLDAMMGRVGCVKWWWDESERVETDSYYGINEITMALLLQPRDDQTTVEIVRSRKYQIPPDPRAVMAWQQAARQAQMQGQPPPPAPQPETVTDCTLRTTTQTRELCIEAFPPEERIISPRARDIETTPYWGHRTMKRVHELVAMGYDRDEVLDHAGNEDEIDEIDDAARQPSQISEISDGLEGDDYREVEYCELFIRADRDGDGVAELLKVCTIGETHHVVYDEPVSQIQGAEFRLIPTPHSTSGDALAKSVFDIQQIKTALLRGAMESLPHSIYPRMVGVEGKVNWDDVLSLSPGQPTRVKDPQALQAMTVPFVGGEVFNAMTYVDENMRDPRTGLSKAARGLDPDALQSTPKEAAAAMVGATQMKLEYYARMLAETGMRQLFKGLLREVVRNQRDPTQMKVNGKWLDIDPRAWSADMEISIDPAPGTGDLQGKVAAVQAVIGYQLPILEKLGPQNPLASLSQIYNALSKFVQLTGLGRNVNRYFSDPSGQPVQPPQGPQDPNAALAEAEIAKAKLQDDTKRYQLQLEDDRQRDKIELEVVLKCADLLAKYGVAVNPQELIQFMRMPRPPGTLPAPPNPHDPQQGQQPPPGMGVPAMPQGA